MLDAGPGDDTLVLRDGDALGRWLASLGRPVSRAELERVHEAREALGPFIAAGAGWFVPLTGANGLEGVIVAGEALDPGVHTLQSREALETWGECAASACVHARRHREARRRTVEWLAERVAEHPGLREALRDALGQQGDHAA